VIVLDEIWNTILHKKHLFASYKDDLTFLQVAILFFANYGLTVIGRLGQAS
jgi:hypothetical protein